LDPFNESSVGDDTGGLLDRRRRQLVEQPHAFIGAGVAGDSEEGREERKESTERGHASAWPSLPVAATGTDDAARTAHIDPGGPMLLQWADVA
jgi:hypothetical protein